MQPTADQLSAVLALYNRGKTASAYRLAASYAPLKEWRGAEARVLAGRVCSNVGAQRLGRDLHRLAYREDPRDPQATYYAAREVAERRGPVAAWDFLQRHGELPEAAPELRGDWFAFHCDVLASVRDFDVAEQWLARAEALAPEKPWVQMERCHLMERRDNYPEALAAARRAMELHGWYRPAVQSIAHLLVLMDRDQEALQILLEASTQMDNAPVWGQLATIQTELGLHADARASWERVAEYSPGMEEPYRKLVLAYQSDAAYHSGDLEAAIELGRSSESTFHKSAADKMAESLAGQNHRVRVSLPVPFVRQHHMTCAPATLSAVSRFWGIDAEHLGVAEDICYDGTPAHSERKWAETHGWRVREFTVTWDATRRLIDRGVPFTLTSVEATSAHLQAVIGYDALRGTLLIRDPFERTFREFVAEPFFDYQAWAGPRGMAMVPVEKASLLDDLPLEDEALFDDSHRLQLALQEHRRDAAVTVLREMTARSPAHRLTLAARRSVAAYDANHAEALAATEAMLAAYPGTPGLVLAKLSLLRVLGRRDERLALLKSASETPTEPNANAASGQAASGDGRLPRRIPLPLFWAEYAQELRQDARERGTALRLLRKALRYLRSEGWLYRETANVLWDERRQAEATRFYRFGATLALGDEEAARSYFIASRHLKQVEAALDLLRGRARIAGKRSSQPAKTLFWALEELDRTAEAFESLDDSLRVIGDGDGDFLLFAAEARARYGQFETAQELLDRARDRCRPRALLRVSAQVAGYRGDASAAKDFWLKLLEFEPLAMDAHQNVARLMSESAGHEAAVQHLADAATRFPHNLPLHQLWATYLRDDGPGAVEPVVRNMLEVHGDEPWARRELIGLLLNTERNDEALAESEQLLKTDPASASSQYYRGRALLAVGRRDEGRAALREALRYSIDAEWAAHELIRASEDLGRKREDLAFIHDELVRQTIFGDGLLAFRNLASELWPPEQVLERLREALAARPDLWHAWSAVSQQLAEMNQLDDALAVAQEAVEQFPLLPRIWYDLAEVQRLRGDGDAETAALRKALEISPGWSAVVRRLADAHERRGEFTASHDLLTQAVARAPLDARNHAGLADALWKLDRRDEAVDRMGRAVEIEPGYTWAWDMLLRWARELKRPELVVDRARKLAQTRPTEARSWMTVARILQDKSDLPERLAALERAIGLNARYVEAIDLKATLLAGERRWDEAAAACTGTAFGTSLPTPLRGRLAWISAMRGDRQAAIKAMRAILQDEPSYQWGWRQLVEWCKQVGDQPGRLDAATMLGKYWPHDLGSLEELGDARLEAKDRAGAKAAYHRATELEPAAEYAADRLFDLQLEDNEHRDAADTLARLIKHCANPRTKARRVQLACKTEDRPLAFDTLAELCVTDFDTAWPVESSVKAILAAGWTQTLEAVLREALQKSHCQPAVAEQYVGHLAKGRRWREGEDVTDALGHTGTIGEAATCAYLHHLCEKGATDPQLARRLRRYLKRRRKALSGPTRTWGTAGFALHTIRRYREVIAWMYDWPSHDDAEGWMYVNYAEALRALGKDAAARPVNEKGLEKSPGGTPRGIHSLWLAADALLAGKEETAQNYLKEPAIGVTGVSYQFMQAHLTGLLEVMRSGAPRKDFTEVWKKIVAARARYTDLVKDREQLRLYRRSLRKLAGRSIGLRNKLRCWRAWVDPNMTRK